MMAELGLCTAGLIISVIVENYIVLCIEMSVMLCYDHRMTWTVSLKVANRSKV